MREIVARWRAETVSLECRVVQVGSEIGKVLVLEQVRGAQTWRLTLKASLIESASTLPKSPDELAEAQIHYGYVANVAQDSVFVRFLNGLTGRAGENHSSHHHNEH